MPYEPPSGWLERRDDPTNEETSLRSRFHRRRDCERVAHPEALVTTDRPYSAPRCPSCAPA
jgi:hypothetical protein